MYPNKERTRKKEREMNHSLDRLFWFVMYPWYLIEATRFETIKTRKVYMIFLWALVFASCIYVQSQSGSLMIWKVFVWSYIIGLLLTFLTLGIRLKFVLQSAEAITTGIFWVTLIIMLVSPKL